MQVLCFIYFCLKNGKFYGVSSNYLNIMTWSTVNGQRSTVNGQRSTVNGQRSTVNGLVACVAKWIKGFSCSRSVWKL